MLTLEKLREPAYMAQFMQVMHLKVLRKVQTQIKDKEENQKDKNKTW